MMPTFNNPRPLHKSYESHRMFTNLCQDLDNLPENEGAEKRDYDLLNLILDKKRGKLEILIGEEIGEHLYYLLRFQKAGQRPNRSVTTRLGSLFEASAKHEPMRRSSLRILERSQYPVSLYNILVDKGDRRSTRNSFRPCDVPQESQSASKSSSSLTSATRTGVAPSTGGISSIPKPITSVANNLDSSQNESKIKTTAPAKTIRRRYASLKDIGSGLEPTLLKRRRGMVEKGKFLKTVQCIKHIEYSYNGISITLTSEEAPGQEVRMEHFDYWKLDKPVTKVREYLELNPTMHTKLKGTVAMENFLKVVYEKTDSDLVNQMAPTLVM